MINRQFGLEEVRDIAASGCSLKEISDKLGYSLSHASNLIREKFGRSYLDLRYEGLKKELENVLSGKNYIFEVRQKFRYSPHSFYHAIENLGMSEIYYVEKPFTAQALVRLKESLKEGGKPEIDELVNQGYSQIFMSAILHLTNKTGCTRQFIDQYILGSGQHQLWMDNRNMRKGKKVKLRILANFSIRRYFAS